MSGTPIIGIGDSFEFSSVISPTVFTTLNGVDSIATSGDKVATEKTTTMASLSGVDTFIGSTQDPGTIDIKAFFYAGETSQLALEAIRLAGIAVQCKVLYGTSNSCTFTGIIETMTVSWPMEKPARLDVKVKISGPKVYV